MVDSSREVNRLFSSSANAAAGDSLVTRSNGVTDWLGNNTVYTTRDGFDLVWRQKYLQNTMADLESSIRGIEQNANLSDTEKMFSMQMTMNTWSAVSNLRTNMLKTVADTLKSIARNVN